MQFEADRVVADAIQGRVARVLKDEPDPRFIRGLRADLRARHARATGRLWWFDIEVPFGQLRVVHDGRLVHLTTNDRNGFEALSESRLGFVPGPRDDSRVRTAVLGVLAGRRRGSDLAYLGDLGEFQRSVLAVTSRIPRGEVRPYGWVARQLGVGGAVRATGTALGHNPVPFIVPCHRVVRADWRLGEYSAGGPGVKANILRWEGVDVERLGSLADRSVRFQGSRTTHIFCLPTCYSGKHLQPANMVDFHTEKEARAAGYRPCRLCRPA
jgi:O-6-methylguanine DNA methyltransferase